MTLIEGKEQVEAARKELNWIAIGTGPGNVCQTCNVEVDAWKSGFGVDPDTGDVVQICQGGGPAARFKLPETGGNRVWHLRRYAF